MSTTFTLLIIQNESVRKIDLKGSVNTVGRDPSADILIPDPAISRRQFTLTQRGDHVVIEMNPQSRYQAVKNGRSAMQLELYPGERFELGPYKFEIQGQVALPQAQRGPLDEDPGGPVQLSLAEEEKRIAPRWSSHAEAVDEEAKAAAESAPAEGVPMWRRIGLPGAALLVVGFLAYDLLKPEPPPAPSAAQEALPDLLAAVQPIDCQSPEVCLNRAQELHQIGIKLAESGTRDLLTLYKSAKHLHRARLALGKEPKKIPTLLPQAERARQVLETEFSDQWFRYRRAVTEGQAAVQMEALRTLLSVCREDRHGFCQDLQLTYKRLEEQQESF